MEGRPSGRASPASPPTGGRGWPFLAPSGATEVGPADSLLSWSKHGSPTAPGEPGTSAKGISLEIFQT